MSPMKRALYHPDWERISRHVRERAGGKCELCGRHRGDFLISGWPLVLTVHHINGDPSDNRKSNLIALCQRCHLRLDLPYKLRKRKEKKSWPHNDCKQAEMKGVNFTCFDKVGRKR